MIDATSGAGLDTLADTDAAALRGRRVALLVNHTAVDRRGRHAVEVLRACGGVDVVRLLGPEHGVWGTHQDMEPVADDGLDPVFGVPVRSLYGADRASLVPRAEALRGIDAVVYDIQDIGARYYTYAWSLALTMEAAQDIGITVIVLDRPNPIGPRREGPLLTPGCESFCGLEPGIPIRHGLSIGALARWIQSRRAPRCQLQVIAGPPGPAPAWVPPSPNMPTLETAVVYPGLCLLEATTVSEGRGTTTPFLQFGAPGVDPLALAAALSDRPTPGVDAVPVRFRPAFQKHAGAVCGGVYLRVTDPSAVHSVNLGVRALHALRTTAPGAFGWRTAPYEFVDDVPAIDLLWGDDQLRRCLDAGDDPEPLLARAQADADRFDPDAA